jgi:hypothetical protein
LTERKVCSACGKRKHHSQFYTHPATADGLRPNCKPCHNKLVAESKRKDKDPAEEHDPCYRCAFLMDCRHILTENYRKPQAQREPYCFIANPLHGKFIDKYISANGTQANRARRAIAKGLKDANAQRRYLETRRQKRAERVIA